MPIHDWTRVPAGTYHYFHQRWIQAIGDALNTGGLPPGYFAMSEVNAQGPIPDVLTLQAQPAATDDDEAGGVAVLDAPPRAAVVSRGDEISQYAERADRIGVYLRQGRLVAVVEIVSPGNKDRTAAVAAFVRKARRLIRRRVHFLLVDLFPPSATNPAGLHKPVWDRFKEEAYTPPVGRPLVLASYAAGRPPVAYVEPTAVGLPLADMPLFLTPKRYVPCPLEATYQVAWGVFPQALKGPLEQAGPAVQ